MAGRGIGIKVFADLDMAAFAAVLGQMKSAFGRANEEIKGSQAARNQALAAMDKDMVASANRAAWAEVDAQKRAAEQILAARRAVNAEKIAEDKRTLAQQRAILMAPVAQARSAQADKEAVDARNAATSAETAHAEALTNSAAAAGTAAVAYNRAGMAITGGLVLALGDGIKQSADFANHLAQMGAATDTTAGQLKELHDGLMNLGPQVGRSLDEMVSGAYMAAKANFRDTADQIKLVGVASQLAAIEGAPLENTMKALTTSLNDFAIPASKAADVATMIKAAAGDSKVTLDEFAGSVHNLEPIFKTFVGGNAAAAIPIFGQMNAMLAGVTQTGASADQSSQWLRNATMHLTSPSSLQRQAVGAMGGSFDDLTKGLSDPNVGPIGVMQKMNDLISKKLGPDGMVQLDTFYRNKDAINLERTRYEKLSPENKELADQVQAGTMSKMTALRKASNIGPQAGMMAEWTQAHKELTGFDPLMKKFGGTEGSVAQAINAMMGSQSGFLVTSALFGNDEAKSRLNKTLRDQQMAKAENGGKDVGGWSEVADTMGVKTKQLQASMKDLVVSAGENLLPAFKQFVDVLKSVSDFFGHHQVLLHGLITLAETFSGIWIGGKIMSGLANIGKSFDGLIQKLGTVGTTAEATNAKLAAAGPAAARGAAGVETATGAEIAAESRVAVAAERVDAALIAEGPAAMKGAAGVQAAAAEEVIAENSVATAAARAGAALSLGLGAAGALMFPALALGMGAGAVQDTVDPDDPNNGFNKDNTSKLTVPKGLPAPGSSDAEAAMAGGAGSGNAAEKWVTSTNSKYDQAARYAWLMNHPDEDKNPNFKPPADYGQNQDPNAPVKMPSTPGYGQHWVNGKGWVEDGAGGTPEMPAEASGPGDGTYAPDYMGDGAGGGDDGGGKKKKGKRSEEEVNADLAALGVAPDGTAQDPLYVSDINGVGGGSLPKTPGEKDGNPFEKFTHPDGLWGKNGLFGDIAGLMTVFLGELALGNPLGKMMEGFGGGRGGGNKLEIAHNKAAISANHVANAFDHLKKTLETHDKDSPEARIAFRNYENAKMTAEDQAAKGYGMGGRGSGKQSLGAELENLMGSGGLAASGSAYGTRTPGGGTVGIPGSNPIGAGAEQYRGLATQIAAQMGVNPQTWVPALLSQITTESGGNLHSVNSHDSDGRGGTQTVEGLFNFLPSTFQGAGGGDIFNAHDQIRNAITYGLGKKGSTPQQPQGFGYGQGWAKGTPSIVPGSPSRRDDHLGQLPNGEMIGLAGGEAILNSDAARALGPHIVNALNAAGSTAKFPGFAGGGAKVSGGPNGPNNPPAPPAGGAAGSTAPPPPKPKGPQGETPSKPKGPQGETPTMPGKSAKPKPIKDQTGSTQDPDETGAKRPGAGISGGIIGAAEGAASAGADMFAPGSGAAVQIGMQELNRAVQWGGEVAATLVGEMPLQTFGLTGTDLSGRSVSLAKSLPGKILGGLMGAHPASNNLAGVGDTNSPDQGGNSNQMVQQGDYTGVHVENMHVNNANNDDMGKQLRQASMSVGGQHWERPTASG